MSIARTYKRGQSLRVHIEGHSEPIQMVSIELASYEAGGGVMLIADRGDGDVDRIVELLNKGPQQ